MLIDKYLKDFNYREYHSIEIEGKPHEIYPRMLNTDFGKSSLIKILFRMRGIQKQVARLRDIENMGFKKLDEIINHEILFGIISRSSVFNDCQKDISPHLFISDSPPGILKAAINFHTAPMERNKTLVSTETRVLCTDKRIKNRFGIYWFFISPFSRLIRHEMLKQIKNQVNRGINK